MEPSQADAAAGGAPPPLEDGFEARFLAHEGIVKDQAVSSSVKDAQVQELKTRVRYLAETCKVIAERGCQLPQELHQELNEILEAAASPLDEKLLSEDDLSAGSSAGASGSASDPHANSSESSDEAEPDADWTCDGRGWEYPLSRRDKQLRVQQLSVAVARSYQMTADQRKKDLKRLKEKNQQLSRRSEPQEEAISDTSQKLKDFFVKLKKDTTDVPPRSRATTTGPSSAHQEPCSEKVFLMLEDETLLQRAKNLLAEFTPQGWI
eukprot:TRINITY_DN35807_c0_g2_i1.p1 TRINITY_DN35807_c0_g2~~TRINITY_DN35807_c0_g2_i1.p1  ORF type:complete len:265 (-),score=46.52 TRINITY_DN35807_c0_g2_i1:369-1163(-)